MKFSFRTIPLLLLGGTATAAFLHHPSCVVRQESWAVSCTRRIGRPSVATKAGRSALYSAVPIEDTRGFNSVRPNSGGEDGDVVSTADSSSSVSEEEAFLAKTAQLCTERNLPFECVKNARDLSTVAHSPIKPNRVIRTGKVSDSSAADLNLLLDDLKVRTLIDLRSPTELKEDENLHREDVYGTFHTVQWKEGKRTHYIYSDGHYTHFGGKVKDRGVNAKISSTRRTEYDTHEGEGEMHPVPADARDDETLRRRERHFVSLMDEFKYVRGTLSKFRKRDVARILLKSPGAILSRRVRDRVKATFLDEINDGGLPMLNELMLRMGAPGIRYVLELVADPDRHPVAFYCTAGKDRTGILAALILAAVGVPDEDVVEDYGMSANVYAEIDDHKAMVGALSQRNLDPKTFLSAPPQVMRDTLESIREEYGSVEDYLDWIGFGPEAREQLRSALTN